MQRTRVNKGIHATPKKTKLRQTQHSSTFEPNNSGNNNYSWLLGAIVIVIIGAIILTRVF